jgi:hypothetical protein
MSLRREALASLAVASQSLGPRTYLLSPTYRLSTNRSFESRASSRALTFSIVDCNRYVASNSCTFLCSLRNSLSNIAFTAS